MIVSKDVKSFSRSFITIALCIFLTDWIIGSGLKYLYKKQTSGALYRSTYGLDSTKADYLVFGSSRACHHYDSEVLADKLQSTVYNCGRDGMGVIYNSAMISAITARYKPKCVIIDLRQDEFTISDDGKISPLFPYQDNEIVKSYYHYNGPFENLKLISQIYPYNSILINLLLGITSYDKKRTEEHNGYLPLNGTTAKKYIRLTETNLVDTAKVNCFRALLAKLNKAGILTLVVISPAYSVNIDGKTAALATEMCSRFKSIKFLNFTRGQLCTEGQYFYDVSHLNREGAKVFSNELAAQIRTIIR
jgi:hypothetical protein